MAVHFNRCCYLTVVDGYNNVKSGQASNILRFVAAMRHVKFTEKY